MAYHRFRIGQRVVASAFGVPPGPYEITRALTDGHERAISEPSLRPAAGTDQQQRRAATKTRAR